MTRPIRSDYRTAMDYTRAVIAERDALKDELTRARCHGMELVIELQNYKDALWKATGDNGEYVREYLEATKP